jgi:hypothetical protein
LRLRKYQRVEPAARKDLSMELFAARTGLYLA